MNNYTQEPQAAAEQTLEAEQKKQRKSAEKLRKSLPTKTTLNLIVPVSRQNKLYTVLPTAIIVALAIALFTKFAVIDRLDKVNKREAEVGALQTQVDKMNDELKDYDEVHENYYRYTTYFMTESEISVVDRVELLDILTKTAGKNVTLNAISVVNNKISLFFDTEEFKPVDMLVVKLIETCIAEHVITRSNDAELIHRMLYSIVIGLSIQWATFEDFDFLTEFRKEYDALMA